MNFEAIHEQIRELPEAWQRPRLSQLGLFTPNPAKSRRLTPRQAHDELVRHGLALVVRSAALFERDSDLTAEWSEVGTQGGIAFLKAVELADRHDSTYAVVSREERRFLLLLAAIEVHRCGRHGIASAILRRKDAQLPIEPFDSTALQAGKLLSAFCGGGTGLERTWELCGEIRAEAHGSRIGQREARLSPGHGNAQSCGAV